MGQLTVIDDVAARRSAAANKAWATRRQQGWIPQGKNRPVMCEKPLRDSASEALNQFEREAASDSPDWHRAALEFRRALVDDRIKRPAQITPKSKVLTLPPPRWHNYPVDRAGSFTIRTDILVVTFACGEIVRAPAVSIKGKPTNVGRGLRVAIAFYQARLCWRRGIKFRPGVHAAVPAIAACVCEDSGETFDAGECSLRTFEARAAQDWRIRR